MSISRRLTATHGGLLIVDLQEKLLARMRTGPLVVANAVRLVNAAQVLRMPVWATEQYPSGLGPTTGPIAELISQRPSKVAFSCCTIPGLIEQINGRGIRHLTLAGIESHVCVAQTALDLLEMGVSVQIPADAVASRNDEDRKFALRRLERAGAVITTVEAALFEWVETADHDAFKTISQLVKSFEPPSAGTTPDGA